MTFLAAWLIADFISGLVHWAEDRLLLKPQRIRFLESVRRANDDHHAKPAAMCRYSLAENMSASAMVAWPLAVILLSLGAPKVLVLGVFLSSFANLIHRAAHMPKASRPKAVRVLQAVGFFMSFEHHFGHHYGVHGILSKDRASRRYCAMTNWLNPILDGIGFWAFLERLLRRG